MYYHNYQQQTRNGSRSVWVYEADLTIRWTNADDPDDTLEVTVDPSPNAMWQFTTRPDKAKGSAWTYCLKYYLFEKFGIDQGDDDPDMKDLSDGQTAPQGAAGQPTGARNGGGGRNTQQAQNAPRPLSEAQLSRMYRKGEAAGYAKAQIDKWIGERYKQQDPHNLTREQYDEACNILDTTAKQGGTTNA